MEMGQEVAVAGTSKAAPASIGAPPPPLQPPTLLAPGFRFHPTDEELVTYYLRRKVCRKTFRFQAVTEIDVYKSEPWELSEYSSLKTRDLEWYFFSPVDKKYGNGSRLNRATGKGYWKATGKDRCVRHKNQTIGMKKTLVFHSGRAPDGKRTNWVMHEYRLCDSELEASGVVQEKDVFVLCRIFQKSGLGPPNGNRYAPFVEEEWDEDAPLLVPGDDNEEDVANSDGAQVECTDLDQMSLSIAPPQVENPTELNNFSLMSKRDRSGEPGNLSLAESKRSKHVNPNSNNVNGSDDSTTSSQEPSSTVIMTKMTSPSTPVEIPFLPMPSKVNPPSSLITFDSSNLEKLVPPGYLKFIGNLENEILNASMEKESLKIEMMRAQAMINMLQSRIDELTTENEAFRNFRR